ncbi:RtcB family protein [Bosea sp. ANAM02]|uniref:RtcB family protein n=1 Tax=Bosea sp. ANAM02 TaxID=2020412 RepID=UPI00140EBD2E|nr:RtcB family protein [Bosea sp. ANAM02]BCB22050.1 RNA-splicing ligase RtcB [Bosea sp. ANAM02]
MTITISGQDLIDAGLRQGRWFKPALEAANSAIAQGESFNAALAIAAGFAPPPALALRTPGALPFYANIEAETPEEEANVEAVKKTMTELLRTPVVTAGAIMPDACPSGPGSIPVGGVVSSTGIHPGFHSADICCSMAITVVPGASPAALLDAVHKVTHFGPGGRERGKQVRMSDSLLQSFDGNEFLKDLVSVAREHHATEGDGNHFAYVGQLKSTGETALVTHHGSRAPGAKLYGKGMKLAEATRRRISPETLASSAWIEADTREGEAYFDALQILRRWTKSSHYAIHDLALSVLGVAAGDRWWNEHNFVFRKTDGQFYHAKGATPAFKGYADDDTGLTMIPLNMGQPILIVRGSDAAHGLGFSPHGAGRNLSRTAHKRLMGDRPVEDIVAEETRGLDCRFFCGRPDISELPSAYKSAASVRRQIEHFGLAEVVDEVLPYGSIMAGDWEVDAPWRRRKRAA